MENLLPYNTKEINFIKIFSRILFGFLLLAVGLFIGLPVNDSITFKRGEIIAENPEIEYKAPYEVILDKIFVEEGQAVQKGDTLAIINSSSISKDLTTSESEINALSYQVGSYGNNIENLDKRIAFSENEIVLKDAQYEINRKKTINELRGARQKRGILRQKLKVKETKLKGDSLLYKKDVISLIELRNSYDEYLGYKRELLDVQNEINFKGIGLGELKNTLDQDKNTLSIAITELQEQKENMLQEKAGLEGNLEKEGSSRDFLKEESDKSYIISDIDGSVTSVFNVKQANNFIEKGQPILSVSPIEKAFFAKAIIDERDLKYIQVGQQVNLKLDAYYYYEHGAIKGTVKYIPERKTKVEEEFYVHVELPDDVNVNLKSGFSVRGDIILEKMRLFQYSLKKIFRKIDKTEIPKTKVPIAQDA